MPTTAELNAGFDVAMTDAVALVRKFAPSFLEAEIEQRLRGDPKDVLAIVTDILTAAEKARSTQSPTKPGE